MTRTAAKGQRSTAKAQNALVQATIFKKCDRAGHRPESNKGCAAGTCQHTCEPAQAENCAHKWTVRYSAHSRQREQSFETLTEAQAFQLTLSTGKQTQGRMFVDPRAGVAPFLPLCDKLIDGMARANANSKETYRSNFRNPACEAARRQERPGSRRDGRRGQEPPQQDPRHL